MQHQIASAFGHRQCPPMVTTVAVNSTLRDDALHFEGKRWTEFTPKEWTDHSDAFYGLSPQAFLYFLPSVLTLSLERSNLPLAAADALVMSLDTSADPDIWPDWFTQRFAMLTPNELGVLRDWAAAYLDGAQTGEGSESARVQDTLVMLELNLQS